MPRFAANVSTMFPELPVAERFRAAREAGFSAVEFLFRPNVRLQFDFYHRQIMEGNLARGLADHLDLIGHIQFSSVPGRHEPQHGEVNLPFLFDLCDRLGYDGWIGCEYRPKTTTLEGLVWGAPFGIGRPA